MKWILLIESGMAEVDLEEIPDEVLEIGTTRKTKKSKMETDCLTDDMDLDDDQIQQ